MAMLLTGAGEVQPVLPPPVIAVPAPPAPPGPYRPARRVVVPPVRVSPDLQTYFSRDDYPASALRARAQGTAGVRLTIGANGRVVDCVVALSSGNAALDAATCRILRSRARYHPALDAEAGPVVGADRGRVTWRLPPEDGPVRRSP